MNKPLELIAITKKYGEETILAEISLTLQAGTAVAITGNSGGGKTTLLSIMGLLQQATAGKVVVNGVDVSELSQQEQAKLRGKHFGFVFQRARLIHSLTVWKNVLVPARFTGTEQDLKQRAKTLLTNFGLDNRLSYKPQQLSLGQLRRVSLARALLLNPPILLADEPTNDLDPILAKSVAECLFQARAAGTSIVIVTHDPALAAQADTILRLQDGHLYSVGPEHL
jgi:putative ABC transport system ATP-binding protein